MGKHVRGFLVLGLAAIALGGACVEAAQAAGGAGMKQKAEIRRQTRLKRKWRSQVLAGLARQVPASQSPVGEILSITVQVDNYPVVRSRDLADSELQVAGIFRHAGIQIVWIKGPPERLPVLKKVGWVDLPDVDLKLLTSSMCQRLPFGYETMGFALPCSRGEDACVAFVSYPRVEEFAAGGFAPLQRVLACAIAHEIGHLLLGPKSHSAVGIMRSEWERANFAPDALALSSLLFTASQAELLKSSVRERVRRKRAEIADREKAQQGSPEVDQLCSPE